MLKVGITRQSHVCPYCEGTSFTLDGLRVTKHGSVQRYYCTFCDRRFTPQVTKHRAYPVRVIVETLSRYNRLHPLPDVIDGVRKKFGVKVPTSTARRWISEFATYPHSSACAMPHANTPFPHTRRSSSTASITGRSTTSSTTARRPTSSRYPSQQRTTRTPSHIPRLDPRELSARALPQGDPARLSSEERLPCSRHPHHRATRQRRGRECALRAPGGRQEQAPARERAGVHARERLGHGRRRGAYRPHLRGCPPLSHQARLHGASPARQGDVYTGHIDIVQIRNGQVHILDYKPDAKHIKPVEQLMIYALALARRSHMLLYHFRCAWFDDRNYYEFYPLHVVKRPGVLPR
jgi:transposase-like protein